MGCLTGSRLGRDMKKLGRKLSRYARKHTGKFIFEVAVAVSAAAVLAILGLNAGSNSSVTTNITRPQRNRPVSPYGTQTNVPFTVENTARTGVWALRGPVMTSFSGHGERPPNAARWLPNGTIVHARCARPGTYYEVELSGRSTHWRFFAELEDGSYVPMAGFEQTSEDGAQHMVHCGIA